MTTVDRTTPEKNETTVSASNAGPNSLKERKQIKWLPFLYVVGMHVGALGAFFTFSWPALFVCLFLYWITGCLGITLCYHRLLTHRSFTAPKPLEYVLTAFASLACQGGPISWVAAHRLHHMKSDQPGDPHSPRDGFFWAHMGWCLTRNDEIDVYENYSRYAPDLARDRMHLFFDNFPLVWTIPLVIGLYLWGGWPLVVWGIFVRTVLVYHSTWLVNSATHKWGYQTYRSNDNSMNLWWVALLTHGEGWHNNHHAFQTSARHGLKFWEIDTTYWLIKFLEFFQLAKDVKIPSRYLQESHLLAPAT